MTFFYAAIGAIALHIVDDSFLQPNPGTSATDHLVSGFVPLALLGLAAFAYPRVRTGAQATLTLALVAPAILSGSEAVYYASQNGMSGDDYTGLVALAAGPVLFVLGVVSLWRSRRRDDHPVRRYGRRFLKGAAGLVTLVFAGMPLAVAYVGSHVARVEVPAFALGVPYEDVKLHTSDGLELEGWYVPSRNHAAVIVFPGRSGTRKQARMLARHGYGVLLFDRRGEGDSEGDPNGFGWDFDKDIRAGIDFLKARSDVDPGRIGALGLSVGGEMLLETASQTTDLAAVVSEGAGARTMSEELDASEGMANITTFGTYVLRDLANSVLQNRLPPENLNDLIPRIGRRPLFLIYSNEDGNLNPQYHRAARGPKSIWKVPAGGHTDGIDVMPKEYERRVVGFFDRWLAGR